MHSPCGNKRRTPSMRNQSINATKSLPTRFNPTQSLHIYLQPHMRVFFRQCATRIRSVLTSVNYRGTRGSTCWTKFERCTHTRVFITSICNICFACAALALYILLVNNVKMFRDLTFHVLVCVVWYCVCVNTVANGVG